MAVLCADPSLATDLHQRLDELLGPLLSTSPRLPFHHTDYYHAEMGPDLLRWIVGLERVFDTAHLPQLKLLAARLEDHFRTSSGARRINLDPGYVTRAKVVLASSKNHAHRIHVGRGVFAHLTYAVRAGRLQPLDWTHPDYREPALLDYFEELRARLGGSSTALGAWTPPPDDPTPGAP